MFFSLQFSLFCITLLFAFDMYLLHWLHNNIFSLARYVLWLTERGSKRKAWYNNDVLFIMSYSVVWLYVLRTTSPCIVGYECITFERWLVFVCFRLALFLRMEFSLDYKFAFQFTRIHVRIKTKQLILILLLHRQFYILNGYFLLTWTKLHRPTMVICMHKTIVFHVHAQISFCEKFVFLLFLVWILFWWWGFYFIQYWYMVPINFFLRTIFLLLLEQRHLCWTRSRITRLLGIWCCRVYEPDRLFIL